MESTTSAGSSSGPCERCFRGCGQPAEFRFSCQNCAEHQSRPMVFYVCSACRERTFCQVCRTPATDECFRSNSDIHSVGVSSSSASRSSPHVTHDVLLLGAENRNGIAEVLRDTAATLDNLQSATDYVSQPGPAHRSNRADNLQHDPAGDSTSLRGGVPMVQCIWPSFICCVFSSSPHPQVPGHVESTEFADAGTSPDAGQLYAFSVAGHR